MKVRGRVTYRVTRGKMIFRCICLRRGDSSQRRPSHLIGFVAEKRETELPLKEIPEAQARKRNLKQGGVNF